ncbi:MAG: exodeoxyribonuclease VII small subunit [Pseudomonadota bacterium]
MSDEIAQMSFEAAMAALEDVVAQLESGQAPLEDSITLYERGAALKAHCEAKLKDAEEKVAQITLGADGTAVGAKPVDIA